MRWGSFNAQNSLDRFLPKDRVPKPVGYVGEFLVLSPLNIVLATLVMVVVMRGRPVLQCFEMVNLLSLREPSPCGFPPSVVELKEHVVEMLVLVIRRLKLVEMGRDVAHFIKVLGSDLADMQIYQVTVVSIDFEELFFSEVLYVEEPLDVNVLMRENH